MVRRMLETVEVRTGVRDYVERRSVWDSLAEFTIFTGQPDVLFGFEDGRLDYRSLEWRYRWMDTENYQGGPTVNYTDDTPFTRILEYRHFMEDCRSRRTLIGLEYPLEYHENAVPYYPINDEANNRLYRIYQERAAAEGIILAGRLGRYRYLDMDQAVGAALRLADLLINKKRPPLFGGGPDGD